MKIATTLAVLAATSLVASAATTFTNAGVTLTNGGNYNGASANLGDTGWSISGDPFAATVALTGVTLYRRAGTGGTDAASYLNVYAGGTFVGSSTNSINLGTGITAEGAAAAFLFNNLPISTATTYQYRLQQTATDGGTANSARLQVVQPANLANGFMLNSGYTGADTGFDPKYSISVGVVPEPSAALLGGLGLLGLLRRRRV